MARKDEIIAAVDFGSRAVRVVIVRHSSDGRMRVLGYGAEPSRGCVRFGAIQDLNAAKATLSIALAAAKKMAGTSIYAVYCGINGSVIKSGVFSGKAQIDNGVVQLEHLETARENATQTALQVDLLPVPSIMAEEWTVDDVRVSVPIGLRGSLLKGKLHFAQMPAFIQNNLLACFEEQGIHIEEFVFMPLAAAAGCLSCEDRQLGAAVIDLGATSTGIAVYYNGGIAAATVLHLGCGFIINDLAAGLKVSFDEATELLLEYGISSQRIKNLNKREPDGEADNFIPEKEIPIKLQRTGIGPPTTVSRDELDTIIFARTMEIVNKIHAYLKSNKFLDRLSRGIVLTGAGAAIHNQDVLVETRIDLPVRYGVPDGFDELPEALDMPEWTPVMGVIKYASTHRQAIHSGLTAPDSANGNTLLARFRRFMAKYLI